MCYLIILNDKPQKTQSSNNSFFLCCMQKIKLACISICSKLKSIKKDHIYYLSFGKSRVIKNFPLFVSGMMFYWHGIRIGEHSVSLPYSFNGANLNVLNGLVMTESR